MLFQLIYIHVAELSTTQHSTFAFIWIDSLTSLESLIAPEFTIICQLLFQFIPLFLISIFLQLLSNVMVSSLSRLSLFFRIHLDRESVYVLKEDSLLCIFFRSHDLMDCINLLLCLLAHYLVKFPIIELDELVLFGN